MPSYAPWSNNRATTRVPVKLKWMVPDRAIGEMIGGVNDGLVAQTEHDRRIKERLAELH